MAITQCICNSYKLEILQGVHLPSHTYKIALFTDSATLNKNTASYTGLSDEVVGTGYTAGGQELLDFTTALINDTAIMDFTTDPSWASATIRARGALIYNDSLVGKNAVAVLDFGIDYISTNGTFTITLPAPDEMTAIVRIV